MRAPRFRHWPITAAASLAAILLAVAGCEKEATPLEPSADQIVTGSSEVVHQGTPAKKSDRLPSKPREQPRAPITIATFNVNWGNRALAATARIILDAHADIVCIQENSPQLDQYFKGALSTAYPTMIFRSDGNRFPAERFGFLSKHRVLKEEFLPAKYGIFGAWIFEIDVDGQTLQVVNVHLEPVRLPEPNNPLGIFQGFAKAEQTHLDEIAWIAKHLTPNLPTIIAGDFNSLSSGAAPKYLRENGWADSFASVTNSADSKSTWHWPTRLLDLKARIDYIFHTHLFVTTESRIAESTTSDHSLVVSRLAWQDNPTEPRPSLTR